MSIRRKKYLLYALAAILIASGGGMLAWSLISPPMLSPGTLQQASSDAHASTDLTLEPTAQQLLQATSRRLRRDLQDAPPPEPPPLRIKLAGTVVEPGRSQAVIIAADGRTRLQRIGDVVDGAEVMEIGAESITVRYLEQTLVLKPEKLKP